MVGHWWGFIGRQQSSMLAAAKAKCFLGCVCVCVHKSRCRCCQCNLSSPFTPLRHQHNHHITHCLWHSEKVSSIRSFCFLFPSLFRFFPCSCSIVCRLKSNMHQNVIFTYPICINDLANAWRRAARDSVRGKTNFILFSHVRIRHHTRIQIHTDEHTNFLENIDSVH